MSEVTNGVKHPSQYQLMDITIDNVIEGTLTKADEYEKFYDSFIKKESGEQ